MHCYQYLAAVNAVAKTIESCPGEGQKLPYSVVADWMEENYIDADGAFLVPEGEIRSAVEQLLQLDRPHIQHAA